MNILDFIRYRKYRMSAKWKYNFRRIKLYLCSRLCSRFRPKKSRTVISLGDNEWVSVISMGYLNAMKPKIWRHSRKPNLYKIHDVRISMLENNYQIIPGLIHIWKCKHKYNIYYGINRYLAFRDIEDVYVLVKFLDTDNEDLILKEYRNLELTCSELKN